MAEAKERKDRRNILIAIDGSVSGEEVFHWYTGQFNRPSDLVILVHVQDVIPYTPVAPYPYSFANAYYEDWEREVRATKQRATHLMNNYANKCQAHGLHFKAILKTGLPENIICQTAIEEEADTIIVGSRGQGVIRRTLMGSVSTYCVHHAHVPVIVVPHKERHKHHGMSNHHA